jgi:hypothetical protein
MTALAIGTAGAVAAGGLPEPLPKSHHTERGGEGDTTHDQLGSGPQEASQDCRDAAA